MNEQLRSEGSFVASRADRPLTGRWRVVRRTLFSIPPRGTARRWAIAAWLVLLAGLTATSLGGLALADNAGQRNQTVFRDWVEAASDTTTMELVPLEDLGVTTAAFLGQAPAFTPAEFRHWASSVSFPGRYRKVSLLLFIRYVPASQLASYSSSMKGGIRLHPPGRHSYYCFIPEGDTVGPGFDSRGPLSGLPRAIERSPRTLAGLDLCASSAGAGLVPSAATGTPIAASPDSPGVGLILTPVYRGGEVPIASLRRADLLGWTGVLFDVNSVLNVALSGFHHAALTLSTDNDVQHPVVVGGAGVTIANPAFRSQVGLTVETPWTLDAIWAPTPGLFGLDLSQLGILIGGLVLSLLAWVLLRLLPSARDRALALVAERTAELHRLALQDPLTGLANRALVLDRVGEALATASRPPSVIAVLFIDLDNFKDINDSLGHSVGDEVLTELGLRLRAGVRAEDTVGRLGGDEFIVLLVGGSLEEGPEATANRLLMAIREPIRVPSSDVPLEVDGSIGIAVGGYSSAGDVLREADIALYQAKRSGKGQFAVFEPAMAAAVQRQRAIHLGLQYAFENGEFSLTYRPSVDLSTQEVVAMEATLRWGSQTSADREEFLEELEASGLAGRVGSWTLEHACQDAARWSGAGLSCAVAVALSPSQFTRSKFVGEIQAILEHSGLPARRLILAVPGITLLTNDTELLRRLEALDGLGVKLAAANPGYAALASVRRAPISVLSIDETGPDGDLPADQSAAFGLARRVLAGMLGLQVMVTGGEATVHYGQELLPVGEAFLGPDEVEPFLAERASPAG